MPISNANARDFGICTDAQGAISDELFSKGGNVLMGPLKDIAIEVLEALPVEHLLGQTELEAIVRDKAKGEFASLYDKRQKEINIRVPLKANRSFRTMSKGSADTTYLRGGLMNYKKAPSTSSYWFRSPADRRGDAGSDELYRWIVRHEFGHSIDALLKLSDRQGHTAVCGSWVKYRTAEHLLCDMFLEFHPNGTQGDWSLAKSIFQERRVIARLDSRSAVAGKAYQKAWRAARNGPLNNSKFLRTPANAGFMQTILNIMNTLDVAIMEPWLDGDSSTDCCIGDRRFHYMANYNEWNSCSQAAYENRVSNYQFSCASEWFAESYAAYFGQGTRMRQLLDERADDVVRWFDSFLAARDPAANQDNRYFSAAPVKLAKYRDYAALPSSWWFGSDTNPNKKAAAAWGQENRFEQEEQRLAGILEPGDVIICYGYNGVGRAQAAVKALKTATFLPRATAAAAYSRGDNARASANHSVIVTSCDSQRGQVGITHGVSTGMINDSLSNFLKNNLSVMHVFRPAAITVSYPVRGAWNGHEHDVQDTAMPGAHAAGRIAELWGADVGPQDNDPGIRYGMKKAVRSVMSLSAFGSKAQARAQRYSRSRTEANGPTTTGWWTGEHSESMFCSMFVVAAYQAALPMAGVRRVMALDAKHTSPMILEGFLRSHREWNSVCEIRLLP
ncbi:MAG: hypothetical protein JKY56_09705 [Kofleriaceae bacterium]|nr:hypothetical protein [Kofleriaceae bacterium]